MKTQKIIKMGRFVGFMIILCLADVFAGPNVDELFQKAKTDIEQNNVDVAIPLLDAILASGDTNDILRIRTHRLRAGVLHFKNPESAKSDLDSAIMIAKRLIAERLNGNTNLSQDYLIAVSDNYGAALRYAILLLCRDGKDNEAASMYQSYSVDVLKLGPLFDESGKQKIVYFANKGWLKAAQIMVDAKQISEAHNIYANAGEVLSNLDWTTPEITEKAVYTMQMGALITSDVNDKLFGIAAAELIEKNKTKSWIVHSSIDVIERISFERQYELYTGLIKAQPTSVKDHSMALLYHLAYTTAKEIGRPEEAVIYYKTLKQKYPNESVSAVP